MDRAALRDDDCSCEFAVEACSVTVHKASEPAAMEEEAL